MDAFPKTCYLPLVSILRDGLLSEFVCIIYIALCMTASSRLRASLLSLLYAVSAVSTCKNISTVSQSSPIQCRGSRIDNKTLQMFRWGWRACKIGGWRKRKMEGGKGYAWGRGAQKIGGRKRIGKCISIQFSIVGQTATKRPSATVTKRKPFSVDTIFLQKY